MDPTVLTSTDVPDGLLDLLSAHLPYSLPLLRRLQFTKCRGGLTPTSRVMFSSDDGKEPQSADGSRSRHFTAAYVDPAAGPETQMWIYSTLEDGDTRAEDEEVCARLIISVVNHARKLSSDYSERLVYPGGILVGTLHHLVREAMKKGGVPLSMRSPLGYDKWLFNVNELPIGEPRISDGMYWEPASRDDCLLAISRNDLPRQVYALSLYIS